MFTTNLKINSALVIMAIVAIATVTANAQMNQRFAEAQKENAKALSQFEWKSRTEILKGGESKKTQVVAVRFGANGELEKTTISSTPEPDLPSFGLRGMIAKKKKKEFLEKVQTLGDLARAYSNLPPDVMQRFMTTATFSSGQQNLIRIEGRGVLQSGDSMVVYLDVASRKQRRIEINTQLEEKPVTIVSDFQDLGPTGPTYLARSQVNYDGDSVVLITENFDYRRLQQ